MSVPAIAKRCVKHGLVMPFQAMNFKIINPMFIFETNGSLTGILAAHHNDREYAYESSRAPVDVPASG
jgi:hypothetical protein